MMANLSDLLATPEMQARMRRLAGLPEHMLTKRLRQPDPFAAEVNAFVVAGLNVGREMGVAAGKSASTHGFERVSRLIELLQRANSVLQSPGAESQPECKRLVRKLNNLSERYRWSPSYRASKTGLTLSWRFPDPQSWEHTAVWYIRRMVESRTLHRLRRCSVCQAWFYAVTEHQRFCEEKCRKKHASESPLFKEKRRRYMAEVYRPREKKAATATLKKARQQ
jgi:hypothetical protein